MGRRVQLPNLPGLVAVVFSAVPAMIMLYVFLYKYDTFFSERRLLRALLVGLLAGAAVTMVEVLFLGFHSPVFLFSVTWQVGLFQLAILYPALETMGKFVPVNWQSYRGMRDTPYYAAGIGVGFAAINAFILVARGVVEFMNTTAAELTHLQIFGFTVAMFLLFVGGITTHGFSTVVMGQAIADRDPMRAFFYTMALTVPYYLGYWGLSRIVDSPILGFLLTIGVFVYGTTGVFVVRRKILDHVVPPQAARKLKKQMREHAEAEEKG